MSTIDLTEKTIHDFVESIRPPQEIRNQLDMGYKYENNTVEFFEIRPRWNDPSIIDHQPFAKAKFVKSRQVWTIYWLPSSLKWKKYEPQPEVKSIHKVCELIKNDEYACFFG